MRFIYTLLMTLSLPLILGRLWWRGRQLPAYRRRWRERFGWASLERDERPLVWIHAVSVGETIAAAPLIRWLLTRSDLQVLVTCITPTGSERIESLFGGQVIHSYMPYDLPWMVRRFLRRARPALALIMETELWPNSIHACRQSQIPVLLLNARLSERSARGYGRLASFTRRTLQELAHVAIQNRNDARRFVELGLPETSLSVTGSIKFDLTLEENVREQAGRLKREWSQEGERLIWIAASTHEREEEMVLKAFARVKQARPDILLLLVPRHPDRFEEVAAICDAMNVSWRRRSGGDALTANIDVLLGDTMGEMLLLYGISDIAFVGGSLVPVGGHNLIEPAAWSLPLLSGPHLFNFAEVARLMIDNKALRVVENDAALSEAVLELASDALARAARGTAAKQVADDNRGALVRVESLVEEFLPERRSAGKAGCGYSPPSSAVSATDSERGRWG